MRGRRGGEYIFPFEIVGCGTPTAPGPSGCGSEAAAGTGWGALGAKRPPGPAPPASPRGQTPGHGQTPSASPREGGPRYPAPSRPFSLGRFPYKGPAGDVRFWVENFLPIGCWKTKGFCEAETSGRGFNAPPPPFFFFFPKRNHCNLRQNSADIFAVLRISFFNKCGNRRHRDYFFFYEGENLIFGDFVGGVSRPHPPVAGRRGAGSLGRRPGAAVAVPRPVTGPLRNFICPFRN